MSLDWEKLLAELTLSHTSTQAMGNHMDTATVQKLPGDWVKEGNPYDCTSFIGPLYHDKKEPAWPMYSYDRPAYILWNAIAASLNQRGWTDQQIKDWLQSKNPRWALDNELGDAIRTIGELYAKSATKV